MSHEDQSQNGCQCPMHDAAVLSYDCCCHGLRLYLYGLRLMFKALRPYHVACGVCAYIVHFALA
eukprot:997990-Pyramimonas_sp.AAC.3